MSRKTRKEAAKKKNRRLTLNCTHVEEWVCGNVTMKCDSAVAAPPLKVPNIVNHYVGTRVFSSFVHPPEIKAKN